MIDLEGKCFHIYAWNDSEKKKEINRQGGVKGYDPGKHIALVHFFNFLDGDQSPQQYFKKVTEDWVFYDTDDEMFEAYLKTEGLNKDDEDWARKTRESRKKWIAENEIESIEYRRRLGGHTRLKRKSDRGVDHADR